MSAEIKPDEHLACDGCGHFGAMDFGGKQICADCYGTSCSCCPEFGREKPEED